MLKSNQSNSNNKTQYPKGYNPQQYRPGYRPPASFFQTDEPGPLEARRMRKAIQRRTIDYNALLIKEMESRSWLGQHPHSELALQPDPNFIFNLMAPHSYLFDPVITLPLKFIHTSINKIRCPINAVRWTPEGRRMITGASSGEFTLWNGLTFNFETILQAHDRAIRSMTWSRNGTYMLTGDDGGVIKYWQSNMNNLKAIQAHKESVRDITFSPTDSKYATCSDDGAIKIWSFSEAREERILSGHGWDVKCLDWHPSKGILASGAKDNLVKVWDPKSGKALATLHGHRNTVLGIEWNQNGNWLLTGARDQLLRVYDIRTMKELQSFKGHKREVQSLAWHPIHESLFVSGGYEGSIHFWMTGNDQPIASMETAHDSAVFSLDWHPLGHILVSGSNDHTTRFWTRNRPGERSEGATASSARDSVEVAGESMTGLPGLGKQKQKTLSFNGSIPGFGDTRPSQVGIGGSFGKESMNLPGLNASSSSASYSVPQLPSSFVKGASIPMIPPPPKRV